MKMQGPQAFICSLPPEQWQTVVFTMRNHPMPFDLSAPIVVSLERQLQAQAQQARSTEAMQEMVAPASAPVAPADHPHGNLAELAKATTTEPTTADAAQSLPSEE